MNAIAVAETVEEFTDYFPGVPEEVLTELVEGHPGYSPSDFNYEGEANSYAKLAEEMVEAGLYGEIPEPIAFHIDYESIGRDLDCLGVYEIRWNFTGYYWTIN